MKEGGKKEQILKDDGEREKDVWVNTFCHRAEQKIMKCPDSRCRGNRGEALSCFMLCCPR